MQELVDIQSHEPFFVAVGGIATSEGDVAIGESDKPGARDGDAMSVGAEIAQHMFGAAEGALVRMVVAAKLRRRNSSSMS